MESVFAEVKEAEKKGPQEQEGITASQSLTRGLDTSITADEIRAIGQAYLDTPEGFEYHKRVGKVAQDRAKSSIEGNIDWGWGELIAFGSLANEGKLVRLAGEDSRRGTFTQRHAIAFDQTRRRVQPTQRTAAERGNGGSSRLITRFDRVRRHGLWYGYPGQQMQLLHGKHSSVTLPTVLRPSSMSTSLPVKPRGRTSS